MLSYEWQAVCIICGTKNKLYVQQILHDRSLRKLKIE